MKWLLTSLIVAVGLLIGSPVWAQTVISVDITKAKLSWTWAQGTGGLATEFRVKCGQSTGVYSKTTVLSDITIKELAVSAAITGPGNWFCAVTAANQFGESGPSNEVPFAAGDVPVAPTNTQIIAS